jgi:hypothetical protein
MTLCRFLTFLTHNPLNFPFFRSPDDDETKQNIPTLSASLISILQLLTPSTYDWYIKSFYQNSKQSLRVFLEDLLEILDLLIRSEFVYPEHWIQFKLLASFVILKTIKSAASTLFSNFSSKLWVNKACKTIIIKTVVKKF